MERVGRKQTWVRGAGILVFVLFVSTQPCPGANGVGESGSSGDYREILKKRLVPNDSVQALKFSLPNISAPTGHSGDSPEFLNMRSACLIKLGRPRKALPFVWEALAQEPENKESNQLLNDCLTKLGVNPGSFDERMKHARELDEIAIGELPRTEYGTESGCLGCFRGSCVEVRAALALREDPCARRELGKLLMDWFEHSGEWTRIRDRFDFVECLTQVEAASPSLVTNDLLERANRLEAKRKDKQERLEAVDLLNANSVSSEQRQYLLTFWRKQVEDNEASSVRHMCLARALELSGDKQLAHLESNVAGLLYCMPGLYKTADKTEVAENVARLYCRAKDDSLPFLVDSYVRVLRNRVLSGDILEERR